MNSVSRIQENRIVKAIEGLQLLFKILGEGKEAITPEERIERSGIKELQTPLKAEKILEEKPHKRIIVEHAEVSEEKANEILQQNIIEDQVSERENK